RYGLAANSVTAAELVTPGGDLVRADAGHAPDLFWAVRGGGGGGVVTALEMRLYPVGELYAGDLFFPLQRAAEVLHAWREWTATAPDDVTSTGHLLRLAPRPRTLSLPRPASGGGRRARSSPTRCGPGPSPYSRPPASAARAPGQS